MSKLQQRLDRMVNKTFQYGGNIHFIKDANYDNVSGKIKVVTNIDTYQRPEDSALVFLDQFKEASSVGALVAATGEQEQRHQVLSKEMESADSLIAILKDNIEKVKENPSYIPQAKAVNDNVNSIVEIAKVKLDMQRTYMGRR